jgi:hypothetical protein
MSLGQILGFGNNPIYQALTPLKGTASAIGMGLLGGKNWQEGFKLAGENMQNQALLQQRERELAAQVGETEAKRAQQQEQVNSTVEWMRTEGFDDLVSAAQSGVPMDTLYKEAWRRKYGGGETDAPAPVREWEHYNTLSPEQQAAYLRMKRAVPYLNLGTEFAQPDPANPGQIAGAPIPINNEQAAFDKGYGGTAGEAAAKRIEQLPGALAKADNMLGTIDGILNDPALDASTGWLSWMQGIPGTDQYRFGQRALQLQGQAFLQAFESLKGGGQITQIEGEKATQAIGRLSTAQSAEDYRAALEELKQIINAAKTRAMQGAGMAPAPAGAVPDVDAILRGYGL